MPFANVILNGYCRAVGGLVGLLAMLLAIAIVAELCAGWGVMLGNFAAVVLRKPAETRSEWIGFGAAAGCVCGFLAMTGAIANMVS
jgi:uncharacterized iron-regulated membrane protein